MKGQDESLDQFYDLEIWIKIPSSSQTHFYDTRDCIFSHKRTFYEQAVSQLDP